MSGSMEFDELLHLFGSASSLPQLPKSPLRLSELLDKPDASQNEIEQLIHSDPALTAGILRAASSALFGRAKPVTTVREAVMLLGFRSLRSLAVALWTSALVSESTHRSQLDTDRFARNGNFVGALASQLYRRRFSGGSGGRWSHEEIFAAGVLHNVLFGLLSYVAPKEFDQLYTMAMEKEIGLTQTFLMVHGRDISDLAPRASEALGLPDVFIETVMGIDDPTGTLELRIPLIHLNFARGIAEERGMGLVPWALPWTPSEEVADVMALEDEVLEECIGEARKLLILSGIRSA